MGNKISAIYLSSKVTSTIIYSQVVNWIKLLNETNSVDFTLIFQVPIIDLFKKSERTKYNEIQKTIGKKVVLIPILRTKWNFWLEELYLYFYLLINSKPKQPLIIQTRTDKHFNLIKYLKKYRKIFFVYEHRGVGAEEYINNLGYENIEEVNDKLIRKKYQNIITVYKNNFDIADSIVNVSEQMRKYVLEKFGQKYSAKLEVIPGNADENSFYFSQSVRSATRAKLGLTDNQIVLLYSGSLKQNWHMREFIFKVVAYTQKINTNIFFVCITPDTLLATELIKTNRIDSKNYSLLFVSNSEINQYLNAADIGVVFRENIATNKYSSPTKIAEYLLAGLPVILSHNIGDYSNYVKTHNLGVVVENNEDCVINNLKHCLSLSKETISKQAVKDYSKQSLLNKYIQIYNKLNNQEYLPD